MYVGAVPIYWGTPDVREYFNPKSFINVNDFDSFDACIEYVKKVDNDPALYQKYRDAVPVLKTSKMHNMTKDKMGEWILSRMDEMKKTDYVPIGKITGLPRLKNKFINWWWRKKQRIIYKWQMLLELVSIK